MPPTKCMGKNGTCHKKPVIAPLDLCEACSIDSYWKRITGIYNRVKAKRGHKGFEHFNAGCNWEVGKWKGGNCDWETEGGIETAIEVPQRLSAGLQKKSLTHPSAQFDLSLKGQTKFRFFCLSPHANILIHVEFKENVIKTTFVKHPRLPAGLPPDRP